MVHDAMCRGESGVSACRLTSVGLDENVNQTKHWLAVREKNNASMYHLCATTHVWGVVSWTASDIVPRLPSGRRPLHPRILYNVPLSVRSRGPASLSASDNGVCGPSGVIRGDRSSSPRLGIGVIMVIDIDQ